jgi:hypothetical protein
MTQFMATPLARIIIIGLFIAQAVTLVFATHIGTPPDETNHIAFVEYYAHHSLSPIFDQQQPTYYLGDKTREVGSMYHYSMSLVYRASPGGVVNKYHIVRLFSVAFGVLSFIVLANVFRRLGMTPGVINVTLLVLTNLPMVLMMSSAINNDVLVWLGILLGLLLLLQFWDKPTITTLMWLLLVAFTGGLVKVDLIPVGLVFGVAALILLFRYRQLLLDQIRRFKWRNYIVVILLVIGMGLFCERIGGNLIRYGTITPTCEQVQGEAACYDFWINVRARGFQELPTEQPISPPVFVAKWFGKSLYNIVDIQTQFWHHTVVPARHLTALLTGVLGVGLLYGVFYEKKRFVRDQISRHRVYVALFAFYYIAVNLLVNFATYRHHKIFGLALNGRYIIPSVLVLAGLACFYWSKLLARHERLRVLLTIVVVLSIILGSGLMMMLRNPQLHTG